MMPHFIFLTGKLAEPALSRLLAELGPRVGFEYTVAVLPITVAALATTPWIATHFTPERNFDRIILPGLCNGDVGVLITAWGQPAVVKGPADLREEIGQLRAFLGQRFARLGQFSLKEGPVLGIRCL